MEKPIIITAINVDKSYIKKLIAKGFIVKEEYIDFNKPSLLNNIKKYIIKRNKYAKK